MKRWTLWEQGDWLARNGNFLRLCSYDVLVENAVMKNHRQDRPGGGARGNMQFAVSGFMEDERMFEMTHNPEAETTGFSVWNGEGWEAAPEIDLGHRSRAVPLSPENNLLTHKVVLFASEPAEYGSKEQLLTAIRNYVHRYVDLSPDFERLASYYVLLSWLYDGFHEVPYLRVKGEPGCGKSRFLLILGAICYKPILEAGPSKEYA